MLCKLTFLQFFFNFFHGQVRENLSTPLEELLKVVKFYRGFYGGGGGEEREKTCPRRGCQQSGVKCFLLMDFFAMFTSLMFK